MKAKVVGGTDNIGSFIEFEYKDGLTVKLIIGKEQITGTMIENVELINQENIVTTEGGGKKVVSALGWSTLGTITFGPLGGLAGLVFGGRRPKKTTAETNILFGVYLKDGRKYLINSDSYGLQNVQELFFSVKEKEN